jgi:hypothetical protein
MAGKMTRRQGNQIDRCNTSVAREGESQREREREREREKATLAACNADARSLQAEKRC